MKILKKDIQNLLSDPMNIKITLLLQFAFNPFVYYTDEHGMHRPGQRVVSTKAAAL
jgi:hypothetical protein